MFKSRYKRRGKRGEQPKPDWAVEVEKTLIDLGMTKTDLAEIIDINYTFLVCLLSGSRISPKTQNMVQNRIMELKEAKRQ